MSSPLRKFIKNFELLLNQLLRSIKQFLTICLILSKRLLIMELKVKCPNAPRKKSKKFVSTVGVSRIQTRLLGQKPRRENSNKS
jgi:hypothetical protein